MITTAEEYQKYLWQLQDTNKPVSAVLLPSNENIYEINLNTRDVSAPLSLGIKEDHAAETIYFLVDRYYDNMDLSKAACVVQYKFINKQGEEEKHFFPVPFYDVTSFSNSVVDDFILTGVSGENYRVNIYYIWSEEEEKYKLTSEPYNPSEKYYLKVTPRQNQKYISVTLTAETYSPGNFYYIETNVESENFGEYCQDMGEFNITRNYFAKVDKRYVPIALTPVSYERNRYYIINSLGNMEISTLGYNEKAIYFNFVKSPKMLFPWIISGDITLAVGTVEFSIRFYQATRVEDEIIGIDENNMPIYSYTYPFVYNLNTKVATSRVLPGMDNIIAETSNYFESSDLEYIHSELARLSGDYNLYWLEV